jgi:hypothetical protein
MIADAGIGRDVVVACGDRHRNGVSDGRGEPAVAMSCMLVINLKPPDAGEIFDFARFVFLRIEHIR